MYKDSMQGIHDELVQTTPTKHSTYIAELVPDGNKDYKLQHKQDHLVCFLAGSLMLGATTTGAATKTVSVPPQAHELSKEGRRDWQTGTRLLETCMSTHETATGLAPEIAMFKTDEDKSGTRDWYIKNSRYCYFSFEFALFLLSHSSTQTWRTLIVRCSIHVTVRYITIHIKNQIA